VSEATPNRLVNRLIEALPDKERDRLLERCESVELRFGTILCEPDAPYESVYFPVAGFVSLMMRMGSHRPLEMALIGNEGMLGVTLALGVDLVPMRAVVQGTGTALRMSAEQFQQQLHNTPCLLRTLHRYLYVLMAQFSRTAACTHFHEIEPRLARLLLTTHDRAHADHFYLTHEYLAAMLGVRRSGVTIAAGTLQQRGLIHYIRGEISVLNRRGLEAASCECYDALIADYAQMFA
jgi:CRP-like cAMP-binding protein